MLVNGPVLVFESEHVTYIMTWQGKETLLHEQLRGRQCGNYRSSNDDDIGPMLARPLANTVVVHH